MTWCPRARSEEGTEAVANARIRLRDAGKSSVRFVN